MDTRRTSPGEYPSFAGGGPDRKSRGTSRMVARTYPPSVAVFLTPFGLDLADLMWNDVYIADGAQHGDVLAGVWEIGTLNLAPTNCFVEGPVNRALRTIQDRYRQCGANPIGDGRGVIDIQEIPHLLALECGSDQIWELGE